MQYAVLIADDHPIFRRGLREVIEADGAFEVVAEVGDGATALEKLRQLAPRLAVLDISLPGLDGLDLLTAMRGWPHRPDAVMLTMFDDHAQAAFRLGAKGYILKESAEDELCHCLHAVLAGERYAGSGVDPKFVGSISPSSVDLLSPTERRVVKLLAERKTSREIASLLKVSTRTVQNHRAAAVRKLQLSGSHALLEFALRYKREL
ncbi:MAG: response regulator transcription factor [Polyangiaceae bacterium]